MNKIVLGILFLIVFLVGVGVGSVGKNSSSTGKVKKEAQQEVKESATEGGKTEEVQEGVPEASKEQKETGKVEVKSHKKKIDMGYTKIVGEVINNTSSPVSYVKVTATFYDTAGEVIGTNTTYAGDTPSTPLEPESTTPFEVSSYPDKFDTDIYKLDVTWRQKQKVIGKEVEEVKNTF